MAGWFAWWFGVPAAALLLLGLWRALGPFPTSVSWHAIAGAGRAALRPTTVILLLAAFAWVMSTAAGGIFDITNDDWLIHRSILLELVRSDWPVEPLASFSSYLTDPIVFRHYLGYYMVPGLLGKWLGAGALNWIVPLWTWCGAGLIVLIFARGLHGWRAVAAAAILIFFSGMDIARIALVEGLDWFEFSLTLDAGWPRLELGRDHLEWGGLFGANIQFSSHMVGLMWVPKHFVAGALYALLLLQLGRHERFLGISGVVLAAAPFWSPFVAIGLLPFVFVLIVKNGIAPFLRWQNVLLALPLAALLYTYLASGTGNIEHGWAWLSRFDGIQESMSVLIALYVSEFAILAVLLVLLQPRLFRNGYFLAALATMLLLPLYVLGLFNDLAMRGVIPSLVVLAHFCATAVLRPSQEPVGGKQRRYSLLRTMLAVVLGIGAVTPLFELARAGKFSDLNAVRYERLGSEYSIQGVLDTRDPKIYVPLYVTNEMPVWLLRLLGLQPATQAPAEGELVIRDIYDVYLEGGTLVYVRDSCTPAEHNTKFFVHVFPLNTSDLPENQDHVSEDFHFMLPHGLRLGETCFAIRKLPAAFDIGFVRTGQLNARQTADSWLAYYYSDAYRSRLLAEAGEPALRAVYDVYIHRLGPQEAASQDAERRLLYARTGCSLDDANRRFFLHVFPVHARDLPAERRSLGFAELDFDFNRFGGRSSGTCFVVRGLPDYDIREIRTGQYRDGDAISWEGTITLSE